MFAIAYDLNTEALKKYYHNTSWKNAYGDIRAFLNERGFKRQQGSVLYGEATVTMVDAIVAVTELSKEFPWLVHSVTDIRILQLMNNDDLMPVVKVGAQLAAVADAAK
jgi:virulence-associated protein VapD